MNTEHQLKWKLTWPMCPKKMKLKQKWASFWLVEETLPPFPLVGKTLYAMHIYIYIHKYIYIYIICIYIYIGKTLNIYIYMCVCMYICIHIYYIVCGHEITQAMQFIETSFYLPLLHQHKVTKLFWTFTCNVWSVKYARILNKKE